MRRRIGRRDEKCEEEGRGDRGGDVHEAGEQNVVMKTQEEDKDEVEKE